MKILAIETSCDETAIAIAEFTGPKRRPEVSVLSNIVSSQIEIHKKFGGVVPNLARREHEKNLSFILKKALKEAKMYKVFSMKYPVLRKHIQNTKYKILDTILAREPELLKHVKKYILPLPIPPIDAVAVTYGPGLAPALWVGVNFARALAVLWNKPLIPINHMEGHFYSALLQVEPRISNFQFSISKQKRNQNPLIHSIKTIRFPALGLLVSGGHTELVYAKGHGKWKIVGETRDDAAGEAFDKVARILGLGYPGGPALSALAERNFQFSISNFQIRLPRPMIHSNDFDFSFSGLKTAVLYLTRNLGPKQTKKFRPLIAQEFQDAVVDVLVKKTIRAAKAFKVKTILLGGGVAANKLLRQKLSAACKKESPDVRCQMSDVTLTSDNALMITIAAHFVGKKKAWNKVHADANARLGS